MPDTKKMFNEYHKLVAKINHELKEHYTIIRKAEEAEDDGDERNAKKFYDQAKRIESDAKKNFSKAAKLHHELIAEKVVGIDPLPNMSMLHKH